MLRLSGGQILHTQSAAGETNGGESLMAETLVYDMPWARLLAGNNELKLRAKAVAEGGPASADALMLRFQAPVENLAGSGWLGCIAADVISDGVERVQLKLGLKLDPGPVLELYATKPGTAGDDKDEVRVFRFALDGVEFGVPVKGVVAAAPRVSRFYTDRHRFCVNWQEDTGSPAGIVYDTHGNADEATGTAIGRLRLEPLSRRKISRATGTCSSSQPRPRTTIPNGARRGKSQQGKRRDVRRHGMVGNSSSQRNPA